MHEVNKRDVLLCKDKGMQIVLDELFQLGRRFNIETAILFKKNILLVLKDLSTKNAIINMTTLTKRYNLIFLDRTGFSDYYIEEEDIQKYHYVLLNVENYVNIISEINGKVLSKKFFEITDIEKRHE